MARRDKFTLQLDQEADGWYCGSVKEKPGVNSQGRTLYSAIRNTADALAMILQVEEEERKKGT